MPYILGLMPTQLVCPQCRNEVTSMVVYSPSKLTHITALVLCCLCLWPCACAMYCCPCTHTVAHYCPNCNAFLGYY